jgi:hypothetical protein
MLLGALPTVGFGRVSTFRRQAAAARKKIDATFPCPAVSISNSQHSRFHATGIFVVLEAFLLKEKFR